MTYQIPSPPSGTAEAAAGLVELQDAAWQPPVSLVSALNSIASEPAVWLTQAVDIMAFGDGDATGDPLERAARRCQASRRLCQEGARKGLVNLIGNPDRAGDGSIAIPRAYFDTPRMMGAADNSIVTDVDNISDDAFTAHFEGNHQKWFNARIETQSLLKWLRGFAAELAATASYDAVQSSRPEYHVMIQVGGNISQLTFSAMAEIWKNHQVPIALPISQIQKKIADGMKERGITGGATPDNIRRILGLKN
jgi:hypothetical protein